VLLAEEETVVEDMIGRLTEIGRCYRMEVTVGKTKASPIQIRINQKQLENLEYFSYFVAW
jgi:hypothetical protein